jgi:hypothetical protein
MSGEHCRAIGYDNLAPIILHKIANAQVEAASIRRARSTSFRCKDCFTC